ncbi:MAG: hypothetical protein ACR2OG_15330 [Gemmatimonadaceae bacterium]
MEGKHKVAKDESGLRNSGSQWEALKQRTESRRYEAVDGPLAGNFMACAAGGTLWIFRRRDRIEIVAARPTARPDPLEHEKRRALLGHYAPDPSGEVTVLRWHSV